MIVVDGVLVPEAVGGERVFGRVRRAAHGKKAAPAVAKYAAVSPVGVRRAQADKGLFASKGRVAELPLCPSGVALVVVGKASASGLRAFVEVVSGQRLYVIGKGAAVFDRNGVRVACSYRRLPHNGAVRLFRVGYEARDRVVVAARAVVCSGRFSEVRRMDASVAQACGAGGNRRNGLVCDVARDAACVVASSDGAVARGSAVKGVAVLAA